MSPVEDADQETAETNDIIYGDSYDIDQVKGQVVAIGEGAKAEINQYTEIIVKDDTARLWDEEGQSLVVLEGHADLVRSAAYSPDGSQVVTVSNDGTARVWRVFPDVESMLTEAEKRLLSLLSLDECEEEFGPERCKKNLLP